MMNRAIVAAAAVGGFALAAFGQAGVLYRLEAGSELTTERCLPPCACPTGSMTGALRGTFTLTPVLQGPIWTDSLVTSVRWSSSMLSLKTQVLGEGVYRIGGEVALVHEMNLNLVILDTPISDPIPLASGIVTVDPGNPFPRIGISAVSEQRVCSRYAVRLVAAPVPCQADCDASGQLTANDFQCFMNNFAAGDPYANCDGSTGTPRLTANDFQCYLNRFAAGCP